MITKSADITAKIPYVSSKNILAKITGKAPFIASKIITIKNHFFPKTRLTLVAPVEPEPINLISWLVFIFTIKYPVGIEPIK